MHFETGINATFKMKDVDYKKYTEIMDYLNEHHDKAEDVLFEELAPKYNATANELKQFMNNNMLAAIERNTAENYVTVDDTNKLVNSFFKANANSKYKITSIESEIQGRGVVAKVQFESGGKNHNAILKFRFNDDYETAYIHQLKIDGSGISLE